MNQAYDDTFFDWVDWTETPELSYCPIVLFGAALSSFPLLSWFQTHPAGEDLRFSRQTPIEELCGKFRSTKSTPQSAARWRHQ
jgi:hypothetical protein